jgi:D-methionine transport system substrate-binding protein
MIRSTKTVLGLGLAALLAACGGEEGPSSKTLRVGATPVPHAEILEHVKPTLAREGIELEVVTFTDYVQPNLALAAGELEANYFQTIPYLESFNRDRRADLTPVARVHVEPMGLYSGKLKSLASLPNGATIALPSDPTNTGRALLLLQSAGLLKLRPDAGIDASVLDVADNPRGLRFTELESAQLPRALPDVDAAVINTNFALEAGLNPTRDALAVEGANSPYVNVLAVNGKPDDPRIQALTRVLTGPEVRRFIEERYKGAVLPGK